PANEDELDELLDRVPAPRAPAGLAHRVLSALAPVRASAARPRRRRLLFAAAAAAVPALSGWALLAALRPARPPQENAALAEADLDDELLAYTVENWDLLNDDDLDVWLASLDDDDQLLLQVVDDERWLDGDAPQAGGAR